MKRFGGILSGTMARATSESRNPYEACGQEFAGID